MLDIGGQNGQRILTTKKLLFIKTKGNFCYIITGAHTSVD